MRTAVRLLLLALTVLMVPACPGKRGKKGKVEKCTSDSECEPYYCYQDDCVECYRDEHCDRHTECNYSTCKPIGAEDPQHTLNAHGNWTGTPGTPGYTFVDFCSTDQDLSLIHI